MYNTEKRDCKDCARYEPYTGNRSQHTLLPIEGYCKIPIPTGGLLGNVEAGETLNIIFARGLFNCNFGRKWFLEKDKVQS